MDISDINEIRRYLTLILKRRQYDDLIYYYYYYTIHVVFFDIKENTRNIITKTLENINLDDILIPNMVIIDLVPIEGKHELIIGIITHKDEYNKMTNIEDFTAGQDLSCAKEYLNRYYPEF